MTTPQNPLDDPRRMGRGPTVVRYAVARYLKDSYPAMRLRALNQWRTKPTDLPSIDVFSPIEQIEISSGSKPILGVEVRSAGNIKATELNDYGSMEYRVPYDVRISIYLYSQRNDAGIAIEQSRANAIRQRDDQLQIIRACLLDRPSLGTEDLTVQPSTISLNYPTPAPVSNNDTWAISGEIGVEIIADEWNTLTALGKVEETGVEAEIKLEDPRRDREYPYLGNVP